MVPFLGNGATYSMHYADDSVGSADPTSAVLQQHDLQQPKKTLSFAYTIRIATGAATIAAKNAGPTDALSTSQADMSFLIVCCAMVQPGACSDSRGFNDTSGVEVRCASSSDSSGVRAGFQ
jgi:Mn2+/Fe2+ NRAMP family transporter